MAVENWIAVTPPPPPPPPPGSCSYDAGSKAVTAQMVAGSEGTLRVVGAGEIHFGAVPSLCGAATTANTDSITIVGGSGTAERVTIDQSGGAFAPGATAETGASEIEIAINLGDAMDEVVVLGRVDDDAIFVGQNGVALNADGDVDVTFVPLPAALEVRGGGGGNTITGQGSQGAGARFLGRLLLFGGDLGDTLTGGDGADELYGGVGVDVLEGRLGSDVLLGGDGNDTLAGNDGNDELTGGGGADWFAGSAGDDLFFAVDGAADTQISGGAGVDTAHYDAGVDPTPVAVENWIAVTPPPPPPPPPGSCSYDAGSKAVTAQMVAGSEGTLRVVGAGEIHFGAVPSLCGAATTANTDSITIVGGSGTAERVTIDQSGGAFAPGATAETGASEIEIAINLGDAMDEVVVLGRVDDDAIFVGQNGVALNADGDVDVTFVPLPAALEVRGGGGGNTITGQGSQGAGARFLGRLLLFGGDLGDTLTGGDGADELYGGVGVDVLEGRLGSDVLLGGDGNDTLAGNDGNDELTGGGGADWFAGSAGDDLFFAVDGAADTQISGGAGVDTAHYDAGVDPTPVAVETRLPQ